MTITLTSDVDAASPAAGPTEFGAMAKDMFAEALLKDTLDQVLILAEQKFRCDAVGFLLADGDQGIQPAAASHTDAARADVLQVDTRQGPGVQAITRRQPVIATELRFDSRWRFWAPLAADLGFRSVLSLSLVDGETSAALNLYSQQPSRFNSADLAVAQVFGQHASIAVAVAVEREQLLRAVRERGLVGQAQGILMERHDLDAGQALAVLRRHASHLNQELHDVAERLVFERSLPDLRLALSPNLAADAPVEPHATSAGS